MIPPVFPLSSFCFTIWDVMVIGIMLAATYYVSAKTLDASRIVCAWFPVNIRTKTVLPHVHFNCGTFIFRFFDGRLG